MSPKILFLIGIIVAAAGAVISNSVARPTNPMPDLKVGFAEKSIVYIVQPGQVDGRASIEKVTSVLNATTSEISLPDEAFDAIIVHRSVIDTVDGEWLRAAYLRGTVIAGFDITGDEMGELIGNNCIGADNFAATTPNYMILSMTIDATDDSRDEVIAMLDEQWRTCHDRIPLNTIEGYRGKGQSASADYFADEQIFEQFVYMLSRHLNDNEQSN